MIRRCWRRSDGSSTSASRARSRSSTSRTRDRAGETARLMPSIPSSFLGVIPAGMLEERSTMKLRATGRSVMPHPSAPRDGRALAVSFAAGHGRRGVPGRAALREGRTRAPRALRLRNDRRALGCRSRHEGHDRLRRRVGGTEAARRRVRGSRARVGLSVRHRSGSATRRGARAARAR